MPKTRVRPGHVIRDVLNGVIRIEPGIFEGGDTAFFADVATPGQLYRTYITRVKAANEDEGGLSQQRGMSRHTFTTFLYKVKRLRLIELAEEGEEVPVPIDARGPLLNINGARDIDEVVEPDERTVVAARRLYYRINPGARMAREWDDVPKAYRELVSR